MKVVINFITKKNGETNDILKYTQTFHLPQNITNIKTIKLTKPRIAVYSTLIAAMMALSFTLIPFDCLKLIFTCAEEQTEITRSMQETGSSKQSVYRQ